MSLLTSFDQNIKELKIYGSLKSKIVFSFNGSSRSQSSARGTVLILFLYQSVSTAYQFKHQSEKEISWDFA